MDSGVAAANSDCFNVLLLVVLAAAAAAFIILLPLIFFNVWFYCAPLLCFYVSTSVLRMAFIAALNWRQFIALHCALMCTG